MPGRVRLRLRAAVRADRDEPDHDPDRRDEDQAGRLQGAQVGDLHRSAAQDLHRQDPEERRPLRARRPLRPSGTRRLTPRAGSHLPRRPERRDLPRQPHRAAGRPRRAGSAARAGHRGWRRALSATAPRPGPAGGQGTHRAARRPRQPVPGAVAAGRVGDRVHRRRQRGHRRRGDFRRRVRDHQAGPTVRGGAMNPYSLRKTLRALEIARTSRLPVMNLVESGGADLPTQADLFVPAGRIFHELTELSAHAVPTVALVFGNSTAGGAYVPGMCDYAVLVDQQAKVFLGGLPLVKMATGEQADDESLGGAQMHSRVSGLSDYFAADELDAIRIGRDIMSRINWRKHGPAPGPAAPPRYDPDEILGIVSADTKVPFDPREILARVVDGSDFDEYKPLYGTSLVTGWARIHGYPVGVLANHRGVLFSEEAKKATEFILLANSTDT